MMCDALTQLHSLNPPIVHRDFTPDNIVLSPGAPGEEGNDSIKIIDFMVAQQNEESATGTVVGKHAYLPPEQFRGNANTQSDIYALGCTLHFLLTGQEPEPLTTSHPIIINDTVSGGMEEIVARATELECEDRFKSAEQVKIALKALQEKSTKTVTDSETSTDSKSC
jgi:serine/threonine-protein kinase